MTSVTCTPRTTKRSRTSRAPDIGRSSSSSARARRGSPSPLAFQRWALRLRAWRRLNLFFRERGLAMEVVAASDGTVAITMPAGSESDASCPSVEIHRILERGMAVDVLEGSRRATTGLLCEHAVDRLIGRFALVECPEIWAGGLGDQGLQGVAAPPGVLGPESVVAGTRGGYSRSSVFACQSVVVGGLGESHRSDLRGRGPAARQVDFDPPGGGGTTPNASTPQIDPGRSRTRRQGRTFLATHRGEKPGPAKNNKPISPLYGERAYFGRVNCMIGGSTAFSP